MWKGKYSSIYMVGKRRGKGRVQKIYEVYIWHVVGTTGQRRQQEVYRYMVAGGVQAVYGGGVCRRNEEKVLRARRRGSSRRASRKRCVASRTAYRCMLYMRANHGAVWAA